MKDNNLDKLFQEQLKNLEVTPDNRVWNNIESKLKKKKRRVLPFWWFASGIAAMLLLGMLLFPFSKDETDFIKTDSKIIITESTKNVNEIIYQVKKDTIILNLNKDEKILVSSKEILKVKDITPKKIDVKKKLVSEKEAMKKILIATNLKQGKGDSINNKKRIFNKNKSLFSDVKEKVVKNEIIKAEKKSTNNKIDISKVVEKKDSVFTIKDVKSKWFIAPVFAVLNSNSFSNSSPVNKNLSNSTKGKSSFSYGFQIGYKINNKWSIQSGVHLQEMNFVNYQVTAVSSMSKNSSVAFNSGGSFAFEGASKLSSSSNITNDFGINSVNINGDLNQKFGYIEIPVELKYTFMRSNKFNTQLVTGFSSLFLNKNEVNFSSQFISEPGQATNLNDINFSGNLGFDFNYIFNKNWSLNLNPMFKAQLNTFSSNSNGFSHFNIGIYTGIKYYVKNSKNFYQ
jgi:hypothetical protein